METIKPFIRVESGDEYSRLATYAVHGFWSGASVRVMQSKDVRSHGMKAWDAPRIGWSCGVEDRKAEPDRIFATKCFADALADASQLAHVWAQENLKPSTTSQP